MIASIKHKGLLLYYEEGNGAKLPSEYLRKIARILDQLDSISSIEDILALGSGIHKLSGDLADFWAIKVSANYRLVFRFEDGNIYEVDYLDYH